MVDFITMVQAFGVEMFFELTIGRLKIKFAILNRDIAGDFIKKLLVSLLGRPKFFLESFHLGNISRDLQDQLQVSVFRPDGSGVDHDRQFAAVG